MLLESSDSPSSVVELLCSTHPTKPLYHYTSPTGLLGIIEHKALWASGIQYLNDTAEFKHAASITRELLMEYLKDEKNPDNSFYRFLLRGNDVYPMDATVFVGSLSEEKDRLSQWRGYCSAGGGFSIGFRPELIEAQAKRQGFHLVKCEYDRERQAEICAKLLSIGCRVTRKAEEQFPEMVAESAESKLSVQSVGVWHGFIEPAMRIAPALKNPSFEEEREWRLVGDRFGTPDSEAEVRFRASKYAVVPYREFKLADEGCPLEVEEIIVGPNPDPKQARQSVEFLLKAKGVQCQRVVEYSGTYRNW